MIFDKNSYPYFILSIFWHGLLLLNFIVIAPPSNKAGLKSYDYTTAYLFENKEWIKDRWGQSTVNQHWVQFSAKSRVMEDTLASNAQPVDEKQPFNQPPKQEVSGVYQKGDDPLLMLLHNAVQKNQHYPERALLLRQAGRAVVSLCVKQDGRLSDILLKKSSGYYQLDEAAILAVSKSSPVKLGSVIGKGCFYLPVEFAVNRR